jgi:saccharopine dehydrogenase (NADP+, L-glutamate forming)
MTQKTILLFGAGFVTTTVIEYLTRRPENHLIIANRTLGNAAVRAKQYAHNPEQVELVEFDIQNQDEESKKKLASLVEKSDIVISLVPYVYHVVLAKVCLEKKKHLVTTSYISPAMRELDASAKAAGLSFMNEIGVDPGIDHIAAVKIIDEVRKEGGKILSFTSWCGGLPALDAIGDNPLKYKFSWSPKGVLMALTNTAKFLENSEVKTIESLNLMKSAKPLKLHPDFEFEGYPNRDSTPYQKEYDIPEAHTVLRGTLRFKGFCQMMYNLRTLGLIDNTERPEYKAGAGAPIWKDVMQKVVGAKGNSEEALTEAVLAKLNLAPETEEAKTVISGLKWMGLFSDIPLNLKGTLLDALSEQLLTKMSYNAGERDMTFLQHNFEIELKNGKKQTHIATLLLYGDKDAMSGKGFTSMAKGTGLPCAIATQLILDGVIKQRGVFGPMTREVNDPIEAGLAKEGIVVEDQVINH